jgi:iron-sulfur cluster repair protein YtfE (RIC family)
VLTPQFTRRRSDEPVVDLTTHVVVHRALRIDLTRLAVVAQGLPEHGCWPTRASALLEYLTGIGHYLHTHQRVARDVLAPLLVSMGAEASSLPAPQPADGRVDSLVRRASELLTALTGPASQAESTRSSTEALTEALEMLLEDVELIVAVEEHTVFPLVLRHLNQESFCWVEAQCHRSLKPQLLPFIVPWVVSHATESERALMTEQASLPMRAILKTFECGFLDMQELAFG